MRKIISNTTVLHMWSAATENWTRNELGWKAFKFTHFTTHCLQVFHTYVCIYLFLESTTTNTNYMSDMALRVPLTLNIIYLYNHL